MNKAFFTMACLITIGIQAQQIDQAEYFINADPGVGNGTAITVTNNSGNLAQTFTIAASGINQGFHSLYVRTHQNDGSWSHYDRENFYVGVPFISSSSITAAEYFFDSDPVVGEGATLSINDNEGSLEQTYTIPIKAMSGGFHSLYLRTRDEEGEWSHYDQQFFYVSAPFLSNLTLTAAEYFFDNDPGTGAGTALAVSENSGSLEETFTIPVSDLENGFHSLYIRARDNSGGWSLYDSQLFYIDSGVETGDIVAAEYFVDSDPGVGNGLAVGFSNTNPNKAFQAPINSLNLANGEHLFYVRVQDSNGNWSIYDTQSFIVDDTLGSSDELLHHVVLYPNPFRDQLQIKTSAHQIEHIIIYDHLGKTVFEKTGDNATYNLSGLASGSYILHLKTNKGAASFKIIKQ